MGIKKRGPTGPAASGAKRSGSDKTSSRKEEEGSGTDRVEVAERSKELLKGVFDSIKEQTRPQFEWIGWWTLPLVRKRKIFRTILQSGPEKELQIIEALENALFEKLKSLAKIDSGLFDASGFKSQDELWSEVEELLGWIGYRPRQITDDAVEGYISDLQRVLPASTLRKFLRVLDCKPKGRPVEKRYAAVRAYEARTVQDLPWSEITDLKTVSELLGHHSVKMTERYSHLSPAHKTRAVKILDSAYQTDTKTDTVKNSGG